MSWILTNQSNAGEHYSHIYTKQSEEVHLPLHISSTGLWVSNWLHLLQMLMFVYEIIKALKSKPNVLVCTVWPNHNSTHQSNHIQLCLKVYLYTILDTHRSSTGSVYKERHAKESFTFYSSEHHPPSLHLYSFRTDRSVKYQ